VFGDEVKRIAYRHVSEQRGRVDPAQRRLAWRLQAKRVKVDEGAALCHHSPHRRMNESREDELLDRCPRCRYRLRGLPVEHRCPEYGLPVDRRWETFGRLPV
jgi:hypothetical protein